MGERTGRVTDLDPVQLARDVASLRGEMTAVVSELNHRRHQVTEAVPRVAVLVAGALGLLASGFVTYRLLRKPRRVKVPESIGHKLLGAAAAGLVGALVKSAAQKLIAPASKPRTLMDEALRAGRR